MAYTIVDPSVLNTKSHITGHVYLITNDCVILGHNEKHNNVASFGGFNEEGETLLETLQREFQEESLYCLFDNNTLEKYLRNAKVITRLSPKGRHYTFFAWINDITFDIKEININFKKALANPNLTDSQKENNYLVMVKLTDIQKVITNGSTDDIIVKNHFGDDELRIRNINIPAYNFFFANLL